MLDVEWAAELGRSLLIRHTAEMIHSTGVLLEGSSHYQLLLTRTVLEVLWTSSKTADHDFCKLLKPMATAMLSCCVNLNLESDESGNSDFPLVGDISPDFPVSWFSPVRSGTKNAENWWSLWDISEILTLVDENQFFEGSDMSAGGWHLIQNRESGNKVLLHYHVGGKEYPAVHGHLDYGGFVFHDKWGSVFVDRGRSSYLNDADGHYGYSALAHNTLMINGMPILPTVKGVWGCYREYLEEDKTSLVVASDQQKERILWQTRAVERIDPSLSWKREMVVLRNGFSLCDEIGCSGSVPVLIESFLHLAPGWKVLSLQSAGQESWSVDIVSAKRSYRIDIVFIAASGAMSSVVTHEKSPEGRHSVGYGKKLVAPELCARVSTSTNATIQWTVCLK